MKDIHYRCEERGGGGGEGVVHRKSRQDMAIQKGTEG